MIHLIEKWRLFLFKMSLILRPSFSRTIYGYPWTFPLENTIGNPLRFKSLKSCMILNSLSFISCSALTLTTTSCLVRLSIARYTLPKPPYEIFFFIKYLPSIVNFSESFFFSSFFYTTGPLLFDFCFFIWFLGSNEIFCLSFEF